MPVALKRYETVSGEMRGIQVMRDLEGGEEVLMECKAVEQATAFEVDDPKKERKAPEPIDDPYE